MISVMIFAAAVASEPPASQPTQPEAPATQPAAPSTQPAGEPSEADFTDVLAADKAAATPAPATSAPPAASGNLSNPEIGLIGTFSGTADIHDREFTFQSGDDPLARGVTGQEVELSFASDVDPYFKMRAFLTIPRLEGVEVEEAYLLTTALPYSLLLKAGIFRSAFGRNNEQHLHSQDFGKRPTMTQLLGEDGLKAPGAQLSVLLPLPWFTTLYVEGLWLSPKASGTAVLEQFFELSDTWSLMVGLQGASVQQAAPEDEPMAAEPPREWLLGADVYLKWKPTNVVDTYGWFALTAEVTASRPEDSTLAAAIEHPWSTAGYAQVVAQVARRWRVGARYDLIRFAGDGEQAGEWDLSGSLTFIPSEFSRVRLTVTHQHPDPDPDTQQNTFFILQLEAAIGAHGAHNF